jgi:hypothetical protein
MGCDAGVQAVPLWMMNGISGENAVFGSFIIATS